MGWRGGGLADGWVCAANGDCSFLSRGEERTWWFQEDRPWPGNPPPLVEDPTIVAGVGVGGRIASVVVPMGETVAAEGG